MWTSTRRVRAKDFINYLDETMVESNKLSQKGLLTLIYWLKKEKKLEPMKPDLQSYQILNTEALQPNKKQANNDPKGIRYTKKLIKRIKSSEAEK